MQETAELRASAIDEILRYVSPVEFATPRITLEDVTIGAVTIPRGGLVGVSLGSANHDESQFPDPETFDIAREPNRHVAFGMGSHFCLGAALARLEGEIALTTLFRRFPGLHLAVPPDSLRWRKSLALRGLEELPVKIGSLVASWLQSAGSARVAVRENTSIDRGTTAVAEKSSTGRHATDLVSGRHRRDAALIPEILGSRGFEVVCIRDVLRSLSIGTGRRWCWLEVLKSCCTPRRL